MSGNRQRRLSIVIGMWLAGAFGGVQAQVREPAHVGENITIPAGSLGAALEQLVAQTGAQLLYDVALVDGVSSPGVAGARTPLEAVEALLRGSALQSKVDASGAILISAPQSALGGDAQGRRSDAADLDKVIVTATRRETSVAEVPYNLQVITGAKLEETGARSATDFLRMIPGMSFIDNGKRDGVNIVLRGLRSTSAGGTTAVYIDDIEIPFGWSSLDPAIMDIDHIEVLRGPQGTLYGSGAIGGALRYITVSPSLDAVEGRVSVEFGRTRGAASHNHAVSTMLNVPIATDVSALRVNLSHSDNSGFIRNVKLDDPGINWDRNLSGRFSWLTKPTERLSVSLTHYLDYSDFGDGSQAADDVGEFANSYFMPARVNRDNDLTGLVVSYAFDGFVLTSSTTRRLYRSRGIGDGTVSIRDAIFGSFLSADELPELNVYGRDVYRQRNWSQEVRLVSDGDGPLNWLAGAYWTDRYGEERRSELVPIPFPGQAEFERNVIGGLLNDEHEYYFQSDTIFRQKAVFGELGYQLTPRWHASVGARYFDYSSSSVFYAIDQYWGRNARSPEGYARTTPYPNEFLYGNAEHSGSIFRFNTSFDLTEKHLVYSTIAEGYRPGGYNNASPNTGIEPRYQKYDPDSILSYEVGGKGAFMGGRLFYSTALYYVDWQDMQTNGRTDLGFNVVMNAGSASSKGLEFELGARDVLLRGLDLGLTYSHTNMKLGESIPNLGRKGDHAPYVPLNSASFSTGYRFDVGELQASVNFLLTYTGESYTAFGDMRPNFNGQLLPNRFHLRLDDYLMAGISARLTGYNWQLRLGVSNLFDTLADINRSYAALNSPYRDSFYSRSVNRPRTVSLGFTYNF